MICISSLGLMPGKRTIVAVFVLRRTHEEYLSKQKTLYMCIVDQDDVFDSFEESCGMSNGKERYSGCIGYRSDEPVQRCKVKS